MKIKAYAKVNLSLNITGKRADGYHTLSSVFQSVSLSDTVEIKKSDIVSVKCSNSSIENENNLCFKAALRFFEVAEINGGATIFIDKQIPLAAGLGGGSADAGAVLIGLNELYSKPLTLEKLLEIGVTLGADVPFCMLGGTNLCEGIGEIMTKLPPLPYCLILIAKKGKKGSTGEMYRRLDNDRDVKKSDINAVIKGLEKGDLNEVFKGAYNCFETVSDMSAINNAREITQKYNAVYCGLSGAGPSVIAVFDSQNSALASQKAFLNSGFEVYLTEPIEYGNKIIE